MHANEHTHKVDISLDILTNQMDFIESDTDDETSADKGKTPERVYSAEELEATREAILALKGEGNAFFTSEEHENALAKYTVYLNDY